MASLVNSTKYLKNLNLFFLTYFRNIKREEIRPNLFYVASINLIGKPDKIQKKKKRKRKKNE